VLPDGMFSKQKWQFLECLAMKDVSFLFLFFVYFTAIWCTLGPFGIFCGHFGIFFPFWYFVPGKIWQPC
jgi:hypothetical protein